MNEKLKEKIKESLASVLPITAIVLLLSITIVPMEVGTLMLFLTGAVLLIVGMGFFQLGAEIAMTPLGQGVGGRLVKSKSILWIAAVCFAMGAIITISEPDLQVLANQVASIPNQVLIWTVATGVGVHRGPPHPVQNQPCKNAHGPVCTAVPIVLLRPLGIYRGGV